MARRTVDGVVFTNEGDRANWHTEDGQEVLVCYPNYTCEAPHPVRGKKGEAGSYCPGGQWHEYFAGYRTRINGRESDDLHNTVREAFQEIADHVNGVK